MLITAALLCGYKTRAMLYNNFSPRLYSCWGNVLAENYFQSINSSIGVLVVFWQLRIPFIHALPFNLFCQFHRGDIIVHPEANDCSDGDWQGYHCGESTSQDHISCVMNFIDCFFSGGAFAVDLRCPGDEQSPGAANDMKKNAEIHCDYRYHENKARTNCNMASDDARVRRLSQGCGETADRDGCYKNGWAKYAEYLKRNQSASGGLILTVPL